LRQEVVARHGRQTAEVERFPRCESRGMAESLFCCHQPRARVMRICFPCRPVIIVRLIAPCSPILTRAAREQLKKRPRAAGFDYIVLFIRLTRMLALARSK